MHSAFPSKFARLAFLKTKWHSLPWRILTANFSFRALRDNKLSFCAQSLSTSSLEQNLVNLVRESAVARLSSFPVIAGCQFALWSMPLQCTERAQRRQGDLVGIVGLVGEICWVVHFFVDSVAEVVKWCEMEYIQVPPAGVKRWPCGSFRGSAGAPPRKDNWIQLYIYIV